MPVRAGNGMAPMVQPGHRQLSPALRAGAEPPALHCPLQAHAGMPSADLLMLATHKKTAGNVTHDVCAAMQGIFMLSLLSLACSLGQGGRYHK